MRHSTRTIRRTARTVLVAVAAATLAWTAGPGAPPLQALAQEAADTAVVEELSVTVGPDRAALAAELSDGTPAEIALEDGDVVVAGEDRATYTPGGELESAWRDFLENSVDPGGAELASTLQGWTPPSGADSAAAEALTAAVAELAAVARRSAPADPAPGPEEEGAAAAPDTGTLAGEETRVVPSGRPLDDLREGLGRLRSSLERVGRGVGALGESSLVVHDDYEIEEGRTVDGDVALLSGDLTVAGAVAGDVLVLDGDLVLESSASVEGDVLQVGGSVTSRGGTIGGELVSVGGERAITRDVEESFGEPAAPPETDARGERYGPDRGIGWTIWDNLRGGFSKLSLTISFFIVLAIIGAIPLYFAREEFEVTAATVRHSFVRSFLLGLAGQVLFLPALVVLAVGILTVPLIPVFMLAVALAFAGGYVAVGYAVGGLIGERGYDWLRELATGPYRTLLVGLAALQVLYVVISFLDVLGGIAGPLYGMTWAGATIVTWIAFTAGFGAVALSYAGTRDDWAGPGGPGGGTTPPVPPAGDESPPPPGPEAGGPSPEEPGPRAGDRGPAPDPGGEPGSADAPGAGSTPRTEEDRHA